MTTLIQNAASFLYFWNLDCSILIKRQLCPGFILVKLIKCVKLVKYFHNDKTCHWKSFTKSTLKFVYCDACGYLLWMHCVTTATATIDLALASMARDDPPASSMASSTAAVLFAARRPRRPQCAVKWDRNLKPKLAIMRQCTSVTDRRTDRWTLTS